MPDVSITAVRPANPQVEAVQLARAGRCILLTSGLAHVDNNRDAEINVVHYHNADIAGTSICARQCFRMAMGLIETGRIALDKLITNIAPLGDFAQGARTTPK